MVLKAFRCQRRGHDHEREILMAISEELFYQGRYVWLSSARSIRLVGSNLRGYNRIRYRLVSLESHKALPMKEKEGDLIVISKKVTLAALPVVRNRRQTLFLFMEPDYMRNFDWDTTPGNKLSPQEILYLVGQQLPLDLEKVVRAMCRFRNLIDVYGNLTKEGKKILVEYIHEATA